MAEAGIQHVKKNHFKKKGFRKNRQIEVRIVGIIGTGRGVGATHFTILTAGYGSGVLREKSAVLEWNRHGDFTRMGRVCTEREEKDLPHPFRVLDVDYYQNAGTKELLWCKTAGYQSIFVDYGAICDGNLEEFLRCDRQFMVAGLSEWQMLAFPEFAGDRRRADESWETFAAFGSEETRINMEKLLSLRIRRIPVSVDAFEVTEECLMFYQEFY